MVVETPKNDDAFITARNVNEDDESILHPLDSDVLERHALPIPITHNNGEHDHDVYGNYLIIDLSTAM